MKFVFCPGTRLLRLFDKEVGWQSDNDVSWNINAGYAIDKEPGNLLNLWHYSLSQIN